MTTTALVALDWGSSQLRAYRFSADGQLAAQRSSDGGASRLSGGAPAFEAALRTLAGDWLAGGAPVLACGMAGSAHGWQEAAYVACPVALDALHQHLVGVAGSPWPVYIVPGLTARGTDALPDVMRGEETQLAGLLDADPSLGAAGCVVMPGTHSKWVRLQQGRIAGFATRMTGELYALLRAYSVLARLMPAPGSDAPDFAAFDRGLACARAAPDDLARLLFSVRALGLFGELAPAAAPDHLSGLLIGTEVAAGLAATPGATPAGAPVALVGEAALCARYERAFAAAGHVTRTFAEPLAARGLWRVARGAGLV